MKKNSHNGFSLVELMIAAGVMAALSLGVMQILKMSSKGQVDVQNFADYSSMRDEVTFLLSAPNSCKASLSGFTFNGQTIKATPKAGVELWNADQNSVRSTKKFFADAKFGKLEIESVKFSMPDYTAGVNWVEGVGQSFTGVITISGKKTSMGTTRTFNDISKPINVVFDTNASGLSTITDCSAGVTTGSSSSEHFTIWGNAVCPAPYDTIKSGKVLGSSLKGIGNGGNDFVCSSTTISRKIYANQNLGGYKWIDPMVCAVCAQKTAKFCFTNFGANTCPTGFSAAYSGKTFQAAWANYGTSGKLICREGATTTGIYVVNAATTTYEWIAGESCAECCRN